MNYILVEFLDDVMMLQWRYNITSPKEKIFLWYFTQSTWVIPEILSHYVE